MAASDHKMQSKKRARLYGLGLVAVLAVALAGCATDTSCVKNTKYVDAKSFPMLKSPPGLQAPKPDSDMKIPDITNGPVTTYDTAPKGVDSDNPMARCLTTPPPLGS